MNSSSGSADRLTVFGRKGCVQCDATCRALDAKKIPYNLLMVTDEIINQLRENGFQQLPVVRAPGMKSWSGFRPDRIDEYAALAGGAR